jgi:antirestriction protein ArdC
LPHYGYGHYSLPFADRRVVSGKTVVFCVSPWRRPWGISANSGFPTNVVSKRRYSGVNVLLLRMAAMTHGFTCKYWATFNQWRDLGGKVMRRPESVKPGH